MGLFSWVGRLFGGGNNKPRDAYPVYPWSPPPGPGERDIHELGPLNPDTLNEQASGGGGGGGGAGKAAPSNAGITGVNLIADLLKGKGNQVWDISLPAYKQALEYYQAILGGKGLPMAVAPTLEGIANTSAGAENALRASGLRGGDLDSGLARLYQARSADMAKVVRDAQPTAAAALMQGALPGAELGSAMFSAAGGNYNALANLLKQPVSVGGGGGAATTYGGLTADQLYQLQLMRYQNNQQNQDPPWWQILIGALPGVGSILGPLFGGR